MGETKDKALPYHDVILLNASTILPKRWHKSSPSPLGEPTEDPTPQVYVHVKTKMSERMDRASKGISTNVFQTSYDPMTGVRTGGILGGFLLLIVVYVVYKGRCKDRDDTSTTEEPWLTEYKKKYEEKILQKNKKDKNFKKSVKKSKTCVIEPVAKPEGNSTALEKTQKWLQDQPFDLERIECAECKLHAKINQFQPTLHHTLSFEDLHYCTSDTDNETKPIKPHAKGGYIAINNISLSRNGSSNLDGIDFHHLLSKSPAQPLGSNLAGQHNDNKAAFTHTTVDIELAELTKASKDYKSGLANGHAPVHSTSIMTAKKSDPVEQDLSGDSTPVLNQKKLSSLLHTTNQLNHSHHFSPIRGRRLSTRTFSEIEKPRYSDGVLDFGRVFISKQKLMSKPRLADIRDISKYSLHKSSPDSITCDTVTMTFPNLPHNETLATITSSSFDSGPRFDSSVTSSSPRHINNSVTSSFDSGPLHDLAAFMMSSSLESGQQYDNSLASSTPPCDANSVSSSPHHYVASMPQHLNTYAVARYPDSSVISTRPQSTDICVTTAALHSSIPSSIFDNNSSVVSSHPVSTCQDKESSAELLADTDKDTSAVYALPSTAHHTTDTYVSLAPETLPEKSYSENDAMAEQRSAASSHLDDALSQH